MEFPPWIRWAFLELIDGVFEVPGVGTHPRIQQYHDITDLGAKSDEISWCSGFVCMALECVGVKSTRSALARSWLDWGEWLNDYRFGSVVVLWRESPNSWKGHVGFAVGRGPGVIKVLGGNQGNRVSITDYPARQLLGYRWPAEGVGDAKDSNGLD